MSARHSKVISYVSVFIKEILTFSQRLILRTLRKNPPNKLYYKSLCDWVAGSNQKSNDLSSRVHSYIFPLGALENFSNS